MHTRVDAIAASASARLLPVESIRSQRREPEERGGRAHERRPAAWFASRAEPDANTYTPPADASAGLTAFVTPDAVAPALARALAAEPWGHPMPEKAVWEQAATAREARAEPAGPASVVVAATPAAAPAAPAPEAVSPAWLTSLLKAR